MGLEYLYGDCRPKEITNTYEWCKVTYYGPEIHILEFLLSSKYRTFNEEEADLFFIPILSGCMYFDLGLKAIRYLTKGFKISIRTYTRTY